MTSLIPNYYKKRRNPLFVLCCLYAACVPLLVFLKRALFAHISLRCDSSEYTSAYKSTDLGWLHNSEMEPKNTVWDNKREPSVMQFTIYAREKWYKFMVSRSNNENKSKVINRIKIVVSFLIVGFLFSSILCGCSNQQSEEHLQQSEKEEIKLRTGGYGDWFLGQVTEYNLQSERYKIIVEAPLEEEDIESFRSRTVLDMTSGKGADLVEVYALPNLDASPCIEKHLFEDNTEYLKKQTKLLEVIVKAQSNQDGAYGIPLNFSVYTMYTSLEVPYTRENWTYQNALELLKKNPIDSICFKPVGWTDEEVGIEALFILGGGMGQFELFCNFREKSCSFDSQEFIELIQYLKEHLKQQSTYADSEPAFNPTTISDFETFKRISSEDVTKQYEFVGFPTAEGGKNYLMLQSLYVNTQSQKKEGIYNFIDFLLSKQQQQKFVNLRGCFSVREDVLQELWKQAKETEGPYIYMDRYDNLIYEPRTLTENEERLFWDLLENCQVYNYDNPIEDMIKDEILPFFEGKCTAKEAAELLQNRVRLYLSECEAN